MVNDDALRPRRGSSKKHRRRRDTSTVRPPGIQTFYFQASPTDRRAHRVVGRTSAACRERGSPTSYPLAVGALLRHSRRMWFLADVIGLFSTKAGPFSRNVVPGARIFSANVGPKTGCYRVLRFMLSGRYS